MSQAEVDLEKRAMEREFLNAQAMAPPIPAVGAQVRINSAEFDSWRNPIRGEITLNAKDARRLAMLILAELDAR